MKDEQDEERPEGDDDDEILGGSQAFRPKARLLRAIGDELISSPVVAVLELVKNAYDADATVVMVRIMQRDADPRRHRLEIIDNGNGMTLEIIRQAWLEPATNFKRSRPRSEVFQRRVLGEKGLGRFAAAAVARYFYVHTRRRDTDREVQVLIDWSVFDDGDRYLDEVTVEWEETPPKRITSSHFSEAPWSQDGEESGERVCGTFLSLEELNVPWTDEDIDGLRTALSRLVSPHHDQRHGAFKIYLDVPEDEARTGLIEPPEVLKHPHYRLEGQIHADGRYTLTISGDALSREPIVEEGRFKLKDGDRKPTCGPVFLRVSVWDRDREGLKATAAQLDVKVSQVRRDLDAFAGINIYRDGFRVLPYGEPKNDWLNLDRRRVQNPTLRLSNNQINGYITISGDDNPALRDQSNREGLIENQPYSDLRELVLQALALVEAPRYKVRHPPEEARATRQQGLFGGFDVGVIKDAIQQRYPQDRELMQVVVQEEKRILDKVEQVKVVLARYQGLSVLGTLVDTLLHEVRTPLSEALLDLRWLKKRAAKLASANDDDEREVVDRFATLEDELKIIDGALKRVEPFGGRRRGKPRRCVLEEEIRAAVRILQSEVEAAGARVIVPDSRTEIWADPSEIQQVVMNLVGNSLHWLREVPQPQRRVQIEVRNAADGSAEILFSDSGPGVRDEDWEAIFQPYFTRKEGGVGLGLSIVGEIVRDFYDGTFELVEDGPLNGANFLVVLNRRVGRQGGGA